MPDRVGTGGVQHRFVVGHFLFPANEQAAKAMKPGVGAPDNPATRSLTGGEAPVGFLAPAQDVDPVVPLGQQAANGLGVVALVGAKAGRRIAFSGRGQHGHGPEHGLHLRDFVPIGTGDGHADGQALGLGKYVAFDAAQAPVRGVGADGLSLTDRGLGLASVEALPVPFQAAFGL